MKYRDSRARSLPLLKIIEHASKVESTGRRAEAGWVALQVRKRLPNIIKWGGARSHLHCHANHHAHHAVQKSRAAESDSEQVGPSRRGGGEYRTHEVCRRDGLGFIAATGSKMSEIVFTAVEA